MATLNTKKKRTTMQAVEESKEHLGFIGLFWYNDKIKKLITAKEKLEDFINPAESSGEKNEHILGKHTYSAIWTESVSKANGDVDYKYYPRGRVVYFPYSKKYKIYIDKCIPINVIASVKKEFLTGSNVDVVVSQGSNDKEGNSGKSGRFTCHNCRA